MTKMVPTVVESEDCNIETLVSNEGSPSDSRVPSIQSQTTPTPAPPNETPMMEESANNSRPNSQTDQDEPAGTETAQSNADKTEYIIEGRAQRTIFSIIKLIDLICEQSVNP